MISQIQQWSHAFLHLLTVEQPAMGIFLLVVGLWKVSRVVDSYVNVLIDTLVPRGQQLGPYKPRKGSRNWAVVTGCTAGIGEEFAKQIAKAGFNLALVSRSNAKLQALSKLLEEKFGVETAVFVLDAQTAKAAEYEKLKQFTEKLPGSVSVLINNLGISHEMPVPFLEVSQEEMHNIIQVNCMATLEITRAVLPSVQEYTSATKQNRGLVMTMGSFAGLTPTPLLSVYSGSKAFLQGWSSALAAELAPQQIDVQLVLSYLVTSQMSKIRRTSLMVTDPKHFVASTLRQVQARGGARDRAFTLTPYWSHALMHWTIESVLGVFSAIVAKINYNMHVDIRRRALRKKQKTQ